MVTVDEVRLGIIPLQQRGSPDPANHAANANKEVNIPVVPEKPSGEGYNWKMYGQAGSPDSANNAASADREETFPVVPEKASEDGYNWRKYGQKNIKGNKHIRSYYRCSYQKCLVKKQVQRAPDGRITYTSYIGVHDHPRPQTGLSVAFPSVHSMKVQTGDSRSSVVAEEKSSSVHAHALTADHAEQKGTNELVVTPTTVEGIQDIASPSSVTKDYGNSDDNVASKRRKTGDGYEMSVDNKPKSRWVVETISAVDIVNDGYRWRKYGQKLVKDNPNARSYYRCTNPGCPAKKRVERASHDPKVVITTYEGHHDHDVPQGRTLLAHSSSPATNIASKHNNVKPENVIQAQSTAAVCEELGNTTDHADEKDTAPEEVSRAQSSAAISKQERGSSVHPAGKESKDYPPEEVKQAQSTTAVEQGDTIDHSPEKDSAAEEIKQAESSAPICKQEQGKIIDLPPKKDDSPVKLDQAKSSAPICKLEQGEIIELPAQEVDPPEEVNPAQISASTCRQEEGYATDHSAEKDDPPEEVDQAQSSAASSKQDQVNPTDHPAAVTTHQMI